MPNRPPGSGRPRRTRPHPAARAGGRPNRSEQRSKTAIRAQTKASKAAKPSKARKPRRATKPAKAVKNDPLAPSKKLLERVLVSLDDDQAEDVVTIELIGKSSIADFMVVASGRSTRHVGSMAEHICETLKAAGLGAVSKEGAARADWILIDGGDVIVHLFRPEIREFYNLEKMWGADITQTADAVELTRTSRSR
ncbi:MAG TPA: ribosome silencing factor [Kiloniellales bacterium]|jgi:ribosome-associated protein